MRKVDAAEQRRLKKFNRVSWKKDLKDNWLIYVMFSIPLAFLAVFYFAPMLWTLMAFENFRFAKGLFGSDWVWFDNFKTLFAMDQFWLAFRNTICMALINLVFGFLFPLVLALLLSECRFKWFKRVTQTISFMPYFISTVVICMIAQFLLDETGAITILFSKLFGIPREDLLSVNSSGFWFINGFIEVWQKAGYNSIMFVAVLAQVNGDLLEASSIDGANRWKRLWKIKLPMIMPFVVLMLTMNVGMIFMQGFDKVLLLYSPGTYEYADCLNTFIFRYGISGGNYALSTAAGLFQSIIAVILMIASNALNRKLTKSALF